MNSPLEVVDSPIHIKIQGLKTIFRSLKALKPSVWRQRSEIFSLVSATLIDVLCGAAGNRQVVPLEVFNNEKITLQERLPLCLVF